MEIYFLEIIKFSPLLSSAINLWFGYGLTFTNAVVFSKVSLLIRITVVLDNSFSTSIRAFLHSYTCLFVYRNVCNGVQREHNKKLNNGLPILHKVPPKRDYGRYFCIMAEKGGTSHGGLTEKLSPFFHAKKQEVNAYEL